MPNRTPTPARRDATASASAVRASQNFYREERPITAPIHGWFTSPARSHPNAAQAKELPLHLIQLILTYVRRPCSLEPMSLSMPESMSAAAYDLMCIY